MAENKNHCNCSEENDKKRNTPLPQPHSGWTNEQKCQTLQIQKSTAQSRAHRIECHSLNSWHESSVLRCHTRCFRAYERSNPKLFDVCTLQSGRRAVCQNIAAKGGIQKKAGLVSWYWTGMAPFGACINMRGHYVVTWGSRFQNSRFQIPNMYKIKKNEFRVSSWVELNQVNS